eukprot:6765744-Prymnesium_polylepis.1
MVEAAGHARQRLRLVHHAPCADCLQRAGRGLGTVVLAFPRKQGATGDVSTSAPHRRDERVLRVQSHPKPLAMGEYDVPA